MTDTPAHRVAPGADIADDVTIGDGSSIWHLAQVREGARLGAGCIIGRGAYIGSGVTLGDSCKIQNYALVYEPARLADGVFVGPAAVFTNDHFPRAVNPDLSRKDASDWEAVGVTCETGASIGARAVCVAPVTIGAWSMVAAGATVVEDVPPHALVAGVPARRLGWVGRSGEKLVPASDGTDAWVCPTTGEWYVPDDSTGGLLLASSPLADAPRATAPLDPDGDPDAQPDGDPDAQPDGDPHPQPDDQDGSTA